MKARDCAGISTASSAGAIVPMSRVAALDSLLKRRTDSRVLHLRIEWVVAPNTSPGEASINLNSILIASDGVGV